MDLRSSRLWFSLLALVAIACQPSGGPATGAVDAGDASESGPTHPRMEYPLPFGPCGGDTTGTYPNCTVAKVNGVTFPALSTANPFLTSNGTTMAWAQLPFVTTPDPASIAGLILWVRGDSQSSYTLAAGPVTKTGTSPPTITITGTPAGSVRWDATITSIRIRITTGGALATSKFSWDLNGIQQESGKSSTSGGYALGTTGLTATWPSGNSTNDNVYTMNIVVSAWADKSGNSNSPVQATAANQPYFTTSDPAFNGYPSITTNATTNTYLSVTFGGGTVATPYTPICYLKRNDVSATELTAFGDSVGGWYVFQYPYVTNPGWNAGSTTIKQGLDNTANDTNPHWLAFVSGATPAIYLDSYETLIPGATSAGTSVATGMNVGYNSAIGNSINGSYSECLFYNVGLTSGNFQTLATYFAARYPQGAATGHPAPNVWTNSTGPMSLTHSAAAGAPLFFSVPIYATSATFDVTVACRATTLFTGGAVGDSFRTTQHFTVRNVGGTLTSVASVTADTSTQSDTSVSANSLGITVAGLLTSFLVTPPVLAAGVELCTVSGTETVF